MVCTLNHSFCSQVFSDCWRTRACKHVFSFFFRKRCQKDNITFHPNNTVSYREYRQYYFEPSMSAGSESDVVTIPNMLVLVRRRFPRCSPHVFQFIDSQPPQLSFFFLLRERP